MISSFKKTIQSGLYFLWSIFLKGLLTILPLALTLAIINFSFKFLKSWLRPIYELEPEYLKAIPFSEFLLTFFVVVIIGVFLNIFVLHSLVGAFESLIGKIPLIRPIYIGIKQLVQAFNPHDQQSFKHVVLIEFPRPGIYSIGFMTSEVNTEISPIQRINIIMCLCQPRPIQQPDFFSWLQRSAFALSIFHAKKRWRSSFLVASSNRNGLIRKRSKSH